MALYQNKRIPRQAQEYLTAFFCLLGLNLLWVVWASMSHVPVAVLGGVSIALLLLALTQGGAVYGISRAKHHSNGMWTGVLMALIAVMGLVLVVAHI